MTDGAIIALAAPFIIVGGVVGVWLVLFIVGIYCNMQPPQKRKRKDGK